MLIMRSGNQVILLDQFLMMEALASGVSDLCFGPE